MANKPWMTSDDIISAVQRKISMPIAQNTLSANDILLFANEEMSIAQIPSIMQYHEEYLVTRQTVPLVSYQSRYPVPERAIGQRLRDLFWQDSSGNLFDMTRISADDKAFFQRNIGANSSIHKYYFEGNDVVLTPQVVDGPTGSLYFVYYLRPNQLVANNRAATIESFFNSFQIVNSSLSPGDTVTIGSLVFTAVSGSPSTPFEFQIGGTSIITATNLVTAINTDGTYSSSNGNPNTDTIILSYQNLNLVPTPNQISNVPMGTVNLVATSLVSTSNSNGIVINSKQGIQFDQIPENIASVSLIDFLQTKPGHKIRAFSISIYNISTDTAYFNFDDVPYDLIVGDYICNENECIIPGIPPDLHISLVERTCARILAAIGDQAGLNVQNEKLKEIETRQGTLIDDRSEGNPAKITARHSLLRFFKMGNRRRV